MLREAPGCLAASLRWFRRQIRPARFDREDRLSVGGPTMAIYKELCDNGMITGFCRFHGGPMLVADRIGITSSTTPHT